MFILYRDCTTVTFTRVTNVYCRHLCPFVQIILCYITSLYKSKESLSVCLSVCLPVCSSNISADQDQTDLRVSTWLLHGSRVCQVGFVWTAMIPLINYFINALQILRALSTGATTVTCATYLKKQADLYLQRCELDRDFAVCFVSAAGRNGTNGLLS